MARRNHRSAREQYEQVRTSERIVFAIIGLFSVMLCLSGVSTWLSGGGVGVLVFALLFAAYCLHRREKIRGWVFRNTLQPGLGPVEFDEREWARFLGDEGQGSRA